MLHTIEHPMAPGSDGLVDIYLSLRAHQRPRRGSKGPQSTKSADIDLEITPKCVHSKVERIIDCYQPYDCHVYEAFATVSHKGLPVCILRVNRGGRAIQYYMQQLCCVVSPPTLTGDAQ